MTPPLLLEDEDVPVPLGQRLRGHGLDQNIPLGEQVGVDLVIALIDRTAVPAAVQQSVEFRSVCPISALVLRLDLAEV